MITLYMIIHEQFILIISNVIFYLKKKQNLKIILIIFYFLSLFSCIYKQKLLVRRKIYMDIFCT